jgi:4-carboxymuconolactone decarboxylase
LSCQEKQEYATNAVLEARGVELPLPSQSTTTPEDRHEKGLAIQKQIVGDTVIDKLYATAPATIDEVEPA